MTSLVKENGLKVSEKLKKVYRIADVGNRVAAWFCASCGVRIYGVPRYAKGVFSLKAAILDDTSRLRPTAMFWIKSVQTLVTIPHNVDSIREHWCSKNQLECEITISE